jgi:hypothetical protein
VVSQADANKSASAMLSVLGPHTIGVRPTATIAEFFERTTGNVFVPQGNNYVRLATQTNFDGTIFTYHSTFNVGLYNAVNVDTVLSQMQSNGYNVVRVWLNGCCHDNTLGNPAGGLSLPYVANLVDFLQRAKAHSIFVILTLDTVPLFGGYTDHFAGCTQFEIFNTHYLCKGGVDASTAFWRDFVNALVGQQAHLENILAYQIREEYSYDSNFLPLSLTSGTVTTANGQTYDMSSTASRQQMMDDGLIFWTNQTRAAIVAVDPTGIVTIGFFVPQSPNPTRVGDERFIQPYPAIAGSNADFVSLSVYPLVGDLTLPQIVQNFGFTAFQQQKPVMMGEFGALESDYPTEAIAATTVHDLQVQSCTFGFKAWLFWTWDTSNAEQVGPPFWPAILGDGLINQTLAPASRPDPCKN